MLKDYLIANISYDTKGQQIFTCVAKNAMPLLSCFVTMHTLLCIMCLNDIKLCTRTTTSITWI